MTELLRITKVSRPVILGSSVENGNTHPMLQASINNEQLDIRYDLREKVGGTAFVTAGGISAGEESDAILQFRSMW
jgi:hypothetical protein